MVFYLPQGYAWVTQMKKFGFTSHTSISIEAHREIAASDAAFAAMCKYSDHVAALPNWVPELKKEMQAVLPI